MESASLLAACEVLASILNDILRFMEAIYKVYLHNPPHYFVPNTMYMVTGAILHKQHILSENGRKEFFLKTLLEKAKSWVGPCKPGLF